MKDSITAIFDDFMMSMESRLSENEQATLLLLQRYCHVARRQPQLVSFDTNKISRIKDQVMKKFWNYIFNIVNL